MTHAVYLRLALSALILCGLLLSSTHVHAQTLQEQTVHNFQGPTTDGNFCQSRLLDADVHGTELLYGTTSRGGANGHGTIFFLNPITHVETILYSFTNGATDGEDPVAGLILIGGTLYGVTGTGASNYGTIFSINPDGTGYQTLYAFSFNDGAYPDGDLIADGNTLYGTTNQGGNNGGRGTVFSFNLSNHTLKTLHAFADDADGGYPDAGLLEVGGVLYGTTSGGGLGSGPGNGTVFSVNDDGTGFKTVHQFTGYTSSGSMEPEDSQSTLIDVGGLFYGTSEDGGSHNSGCIYSVNPSTGAVQTLYSFKSMANDGYESFAGLVNVSGVLYGTAAYGGSNANGTVFSLNPDGTNYQIRYNFSPTQTGEVNPDGSTPEASLIAVGGTLYGTTFNQGSVSDGTVFALFSSTATAPVAKNDNGRGIANHTVVVAAPGVLGNDNNGGCSPLTASLITSPTHGKITFNSDGSLNYTPNTGFVGADSFTYKDTNALGTSNTATCVLTIGPIANPDNGRTYYNTAVTITAPGVLGNDITGGLSTTAMLVTNPTHGTITFNSDGSFKYTPTSGYLGTDSFTYKITNAAGTSNTATCTMQVQARTPIAVNDHGTVTHNTTATFAAPAVLGNDNPGTNTGVTAALITNPSHGTIIFNSDGSFKYTPTIGFIGTDSFTYKDTNAVGTSNTATCTITVQ